MHHPEDTIVALSTPPGRGAVAVVRLSGPSALSCAHRIFEIRSNKEIIPHRALLGLVRSIKGGEELDAGYLTFHPAGRSYTGEDVVELSCHGSPVVIERILAELMAAGAKAAHPGEFTYRAVLNGRLDLAQAEGVRDLINATTPRAAGVARDQLRGGLSRRVNGLREELIEVICRAEAGLEFAEEPDVASAGVDLAGRIEELRQRVDRFVGTYRHGRLLRQGARVILAGRPNSGKSSLFNRLIRSDRAIVSDQPGTTRDYVSESIDLGGIPVTLIDTAGLRSDADGVESEGVRRSLELIDQADLVLLLCPCDERPDGQDRRLLAACAGRALLVASKADLIATPGPDWNGDGSEGMLSVSAADGRGLEPLRSAIQGALAAAPALSCEESLITDARHHEALVRCSDRMKRAASVMHDGMSEEVALVDLYAALNHLGEITGEVSVDAIHERIFSTFCIGK